MRNELREKEMVELWREKFKLKECHVRLERLEPIKTHGIGSNSRDANNPLGLGNSAKSVRSLVKWLPTSAAIRIPPLSTVG